MDTETPSREAILKSLTEKSQIKQKVYDSTLEVFNLLKEVLNELSNDMNDLMPDGSDRRIRMEYRDRGKFEAELKVAGDILIFSMHSNVFQFDRDHLIWKTSYAQQTPNNTYCGVISIYNFLSDSFKYNRIEDLGYMIGRLFVNKDKYFFVEGKRQMGFRYHSFGEKGITREDLANMVQTAILYAIEFDLLVPPYDVVKMATVEQMNTKIESAKLQTGKRLGFRFNSDDVLNHANE